MQNRTQAMMTAEQMDQINPPPPRRGMSTGGVVPMPTVPNIDADSAAAYNYIASPTTINPIFATPGATYMAPPDPATMTGGGVDSSVPSVENCDKMGMDYDPETKMCVPRAQQPAQPQASGSDDDGDPFANMPKPDPDAWMEDYDYSGTDEGLGNLFDQTKEAIAFDSFLPGPLGAFEKGTKLAHSAANIILLDAQGKKGEAQQLLEQWKAARTGALKLTPLEMIDGDRFAIQAAGEHGILLDREATSIIDDKPLFKNDRDYEKYRVKYEASVKAKQEQVAKETESEPTKPTYVTTDSDTGETINPYRPTPKDDSPSVSVGKSGIDIAKKQQSSVNVGGPGFRSSTPKKSTPKKVNIKKEQEKSVNVGGPGFRNKGGLMTKKKKKK
jgi:hypothetical protein